MSTRSSGACSAQPTDGFLERAVAEAPTLLVFDSGLGGLTVYREVAKARPDALLVYVADDAFFPYGAHAEAELTARVVELMGRLIASYRPDLVVVACNTASTLVLPQLRARFAVPFVGTVPAIKPACAASLSKRVSVLGTQATIVREYTRTLIRDFANGTDVTLVGSAELAPLAEAELRGKRADDVAIARELAPCFVDTDGRRTDTVVLACTHYPLLIDRFTCLAPWPVRFIDPAPAIARRVVELVGGPEATGVDRPARIVFTSGQAPPPALKASLARFGIGEVAPGRFDTPPLSA
jgi:glutamate racemase